MPCHAMSSVNVLVLTLQAVSQVLSRRLVKMQLEISLDVILLATGAQHERCWTA